MDIIIIDYKYIYIYILILYDCHYHYISSIHDRIIIYIYMSWSLLQGGVP